MLLSGIRGGILVTNLSGVLSLYCASSGCYDALNSTRAVQAYFDVIRDVGFSIDGRIQPKLRHVSLEDCGHVLLRAFK